MIFRKRMEKAMRMQWELNHPDEEWDENKGKKQEDNSDITFREKLELTGFALLYFIPICLGILLLMCFFIFFL